MSIFGFIGCGNMGGALASSVAKTEEARIYLSDVNITKTMELAERIGSVVSNNEQIAKECEFIFLGVKPQVLAETLAGIAPILKSRTDRFVLVSMAAGVSIKSVCEMAGAAYPVIRIMPNTAVAVGKGMILHCENGLVRGEELSCFASALSKAGRIDELDESLIDAASAVSGCGPAFFYIFAEALSDGAVACGLPRDKALLYAAQTAVGAGEMLLNSGKHPGELKDAVCSPAGSTIAGVEALEDSAFRGAAVAAVKAAFERTKELGKNK